VDARGMPAGRLVVRVKGRKRGGKAFRQKRVYRLCAKTRTRGSRWG
jgi:hypothetical protein